jgi:hypothetical protein
MLTPSERVRLITEIGRRLTQEEWSVVDLTLSQFGLPTTDSWGGDKHADVINMIEKGDSQTLIELAQHVGYDVRKPSSLVPAFWDAGFFRLFITHLATHKNEASELQAALRRLGVSSFVAHRDIEPTKEWQDEIESALGTADALVAMLHANFHASNWTDQEIGFAMGRGILIIAIRYGQDPYGCIGRYQGLLGHGRSATAIAEDLLNIFIANKLTTSRMSEALVTLFEQSDTFREAIARAKLLERVKVWTAQLAERLEAAVVNNDQIQAAYGVPERVRKILASVNAG